MSKAIFVLMSPSVRSKCSNSNLVCHGHSGLGRARPANLTAVSDLGSERDIDPKIDQLLWVCNSVTASHSKPSPCSWLVTLHLSRWLYLCPQPRKSPLVVSMEVICGSRACKSLTGAESTAYLVVLFGHSALTGLAGPFRGGLSCGGCETEIISGYLHS